jgi:hypothetical protein
MIKTLLLGYESVENVNNNFSCFVYKGPQTNEGFQGSLKDAIEDLLFEIQGFCSCNQEEALRIACKNINIQEWDSFCKDHDQLTSVYNDWGCSFGNWRLYCMPTAPIGIVRGMYYWDHMPIPNDGKMSLDLR